MLWVFLYNSCVDGVSFHLDIQPLVSRISELTRVANQTCRFVQSILLCFLHSLFLIRGFVIWKRRDPECDILSLEMC
jgi:hypothetical protein